MTERNIKTGTVKITQTNVETKCKTLESFDRIVLTYCTGCHGRSAQGYFGYYTMPRLSGQTSTYLENQLQAFIEHRRESQTALKIGKVHSLSQPVLTALSAFEGFVALDSIFLKNRDPEEP